MTPATVLDAQRRSAFIVDIRTVAVLSDIGFKAVSGTVGGSRAWKAAELPTL